MFTGHSYIYIVDDSLHTIHLIGTHIIGFTAFIIPPSRCFGGGNHLHTKRAISKGRPPLPIGLTVVSISFLTFFARGIVRTTY